MQVGSWRPWIVVGAMLAVMLSGCSAGGSPVDVPAPEWKSGYAWSYTATFDETGVYGEDGAREEYNQSGQIRVVRQVFNTTQRVADQPVYVTAVQRSDAEGDVHTYAEVLRQRDLQWMPVWLDYDFVCELECVVGSVALESYDDPPEHTFLRFPLRTGESWTHVLNDDMELDDEFPPIAVSTQVTGGAIVDTPLGPIETARVVEQWVPVKQDEWRREFTKILEAEGYRIDVLRMEYSQQSVYYYSEAYQAIVSDEADGRYRFEVKGADPDGEPIDYLERGDFTSRSVIDGARLQPTPEATLADVVAATRDDVVRDPAGEVVESLGFTISIDPPRSAANAASDDPVELRAVLDGVDALPEGMRLLWQARSAGDAVADGTGDTFSFIPEAPGRIDVTASVVRDGKELMSAAAVVDAHWIQSIDMGCSEASLVIPGCPEQDIPVHPGATYLKVVATPTGPGTGALQSLVVYDASGSGTSGESAGGSHTVEMDEDLLASHLLNDDAWRVRFNHGVAALQDVQLDVEVLYGPRGDVQAPEPAGVEAAGHVVGHASWRAFDLHPAPWHGTLSDA